MLIVAGAALCVRTNLVVVLRSSADNSICRVSTSGNISTRSSSRRTVDDGDAERLSRLAGSWLLNCNMRGGVVACTCDRRPRRLLHSQSPNCRFPVFHPALADRWRPSPSSILQRPKRSFPSRILRVILRPPSLPPPGTLSHRLFSSLIRRPYSSSR